MNFPNEMSGSHPLATWCNKLLRAAKANRVHAGRGYRPKVTTDGTILEIDESGAGQKNPFLIYQGSTWLKFKVAPGYVITTGNPITTTNTDTEITVATGTARHWFYLSMTTSTSAVADTSTTPTWDSSKIPIGWVDTDTYESEQRPVIYQFLRDHVYNPCI